MTRSGSITVGKQADLVLLNADTLAMTPMNNPIGAAALTANRGDVDAVLVPVSSSSVTDDCYEATFMTCGRQQCQHATTYSTQRQCHFLANGFLPLANRRDQTKTLHRQALEVLRG